MAALHIKVELGNAAMQTAGEAADAITTALLRQTTPYLPLQPNECGAIRDVNGNTVGEWSVES